MRFIDCLSQILQLQNRICIVRLDDFPTVSNHRHNYLCITYLISRYLVSSKHLLGSPFGFHGNVFPQHGEALIALMMASVFLAFGLFAILSPHKLSSAKDSFSDLFKEDGWHSYKVPIPVLRYLVGGVGLAGASLFFYILRRSHSIAGDKSPLHKQSAPQHRLRNACSR
jgi:cytochrome c biogenesis protein CcdA